MNCEHWQCGTLKRHLCVSFWRRQRQQHTNLCTSKEGLTDSSRNSEQRYYSEISLGTAGWREQKQTYATLHSPVTSSSSTSTKSLHVTIIVMTELLRTLNILCLQQVQDCPTFNPSGHWCGTEARIPIRIFLLNCYHSDVLLLRTL